MDADLSSVRLKIHRAADQLKDLRLSIKEFLESEPYAIERQANPKINAVCDVARIRMQCPPVWNAVVGEIIHNLRCALDYQVFQLVIHNTGAEAPDTSKIQFPIFETEAGFNNRGIPTMLQGVGADAITLIKSEQPFATGEKTKNPLWHLNKLSNWDKHRCICLAGAGANNSEASAIYSSDIKGVLLAQSGPIRDNAILFGVLLTPSDTPILDRAAKVQMDGKVRFYITFEFPATATGRPVDCLLEGIGDRVQKIANRIVAEIIKR